MRRPGAGRRDDARASGARAGKSLAQQFAALFVPGTDARMESWSYAVDGVSGKLRAFIDVSDPTHEFAQAIAINQCALPAVDASWNGKLTATFVPGVRNYYVSNRAASAWKAYHGATCTIFTGWLRTAVGGSSAVAVADYAAGGPGIQIYAGGSSAAAFNVFGTGGGSIAGIAPAATWNFNEAAYFRYQAVGGVFEMRKGNTVSIGTGSLPSPSTGDPGGPMALGDYPGVTSTAPMEGNHAFSFFFQRAISVAEASIVAAYIQSFWGKAP